MCRDCGCSLGPSATRAPLAAPAGDGGTNSRPIEVITAILGENDRVAAHNREHFDAPRRARVEPDVVARRGQDRTARSDDPCTRRAPPDRGGRGRPRHRKRCRAYPGLWRAGRADHAPAMRATWTRPWCTMPYTSCRSRASTCSSSRMSAISSARRASTSASTATSHCSPCPRATTSRPSTRSCSARADLSLITKTDLLAVHHEFKLERARASLRQIAYTGETIELTCRGGEGFEAWLAWLEREVAAQRERAGRGATLRPPVQPDGAHVHAAGGRLQR